jgi:hypothetical protein
VTGEWCRRVAGVPPDEPRRHAGAGVTIDGPPPFLRATNDIFALLLARR